MNTNLGAVLAQTILIVLGGICISIGTDSIWIGAGVAIVGIAIASGPVFWTCFNKFGAG